MTTGTADKPRRLENTVRFSVGQRVRSKYDGIEVTVTELTERGFKWKLDAPRSIHPFLGAFQDGECYDSQYYEPVESNALLERRANENAKENT